MNVVDTLSRRTATLPPALETTVRRGQQVGARSARTLRVVTPAGRAALLSAGGAFWLGGVLGWLELRVVAVAVVGAVVAAVAFTLGRSRYAVDLDLQATRVVVGQRALGSIEVRSTSARRLLPVRIELPVGATAAGFSLPALAPGEVHEDVFVIPTERRTVLVVGPVRSVRGDPFGLLRREVRWTEPVDLFVHPRTVPVPGSAAGLVHDLEGRETRDLSSDDMAFHALRPYVPGDDRRHVHWKTSAKTGTWMVRQFEQTRRSHLVVALSTAEADYAEPAELELAVSIAASLGCQALRDEDALSVLTSDQRCRSATARRLLDDMTRIETRPRSADVVGLARRVAQEVPEASLVALVTGSMPSLALLREAADRVRSSSRVLLLRADVGAAASCRALRDATLVTVGALPHLADVVRRAAAP